MNIYNHNDDSSMNNCNNNVSTVYDRMLVVSCGYKIL